MAFQTIPGLTGFVYRRVSSMDNQAMGKLTDTNHLDSLRSSEPADYDKKVISVYTQSSLYSNDFLNMIEGSKPYYIDNNSDSWKWKVNVPYKFPKIIDIPISTQEIIDDTGKVGIDGHEFKLILDTAEFSLNTVVSLGSRMYGPQLYVSRDPVPWNNGWEYTFILVSDHPLTDYVSTNFLRIGTELSLVNISIGEFDQDLAGLPRLGQQIEMFESLSSGYGYQQTITKWADERLLRDNQGRPLDILVYAPERRNQMPLAKSDVKWEPFVEFWMRKCMLELKVSRMIWGKAGTVPVKGKQELKRLSDGIYQRMRNGIYIPYNRGEFSTNLLRSAFGDLFYRRVAVKNRKVDLYTNEAGFDTFQQAAKDDALNSGLTLVADSGDRYIQGTGQNLVYNYAFNSIVTRETGKVNLIHLTELDLPQANIEFGQNKKSTPVYMVFDVSPTGDGGTKDNVREVRMQGAPSMTWGYIDGRQSHLGHQSSKGMNSATMFPGYTLWMEDRCDVFVEDVSRCVLIEEIPQY